MMKPGKPQTCMHFFRLNQFLRRDPFEGGRLLYLALQRLDSLPLAGDASMRSNSYYNALSSAALKLAISDNILGDNAASAA